MRGLRSDLFAAARRGHGFDEAGKLWRGALLADQKRRDAIFKSLGLGDSVKAVTAAASSLGGVLPEFGSSTTTLRNVMLADQERRDAMFKSLGLDAAAAAGSGGALSQGRASTKSLRDVMRGLDDIKRPWADALLADQERRSSMFKSLGLGGSVKAMTAGSLGHALLADQERRGDVMRGLDEIGRPWADALLSDQERRSSMFKSLGLGDSVKAMMAAGSLGHALLADQERRGAMFKGLGLGHSVKAMTAAGSLGGVLPEFGSSSTTLRDVMLADQERRTSMFKGLGLGESVKTMTAAGSLGGVLPESDSSTKTLRDVMRGLDDIKRPWANALLTDQEQGSSLVKSLGLDAAARPPAAVDGGWQETEEGLWVPDTAQLIAVTVTAYIALTVVGLYLQEMNRLGEGAQDLNRVELLFTVLGWLGLQWTGHQWIVKQLRRLDPPES